jgi:hypothetical protein
MSKAGIYPIGELLGNPKLDEFTLSCMDDYALLCDTQEKHFRAMAAKIGISEPSEVQLQGKVGDHVGNILPCAIYTSVGCTLAGEAFQRVVNHLMRENDPECDVLAQEVIAEAEACGADVLLGSHYQPSEYERLSRNCYMSSDNITEDPELEAYFWPFSKSEVRGSATLRGNDPNSFTKLNREFELGSATFSGMMSFRSWRDLHRQGFCTHFRSLVEPRFLYVPPDVNLEYHTLASKKFDDCQSLYNDTVASLGDNAKIALQKMCPMGVAVAYRVHANLRQWEFVIWQRSKQSVHQEVRKHVLGMYNHLCKALPWWKSVSRVKTGDYFFARGAELPPIDAKILTEEDRFPWIQK